MTASVKSIRLQDLTLDVMAQPRIKTKAAVAEEYGVRMKAGDKFPPAVAFSDGKTIWLADGWHRYAAAAGVGLTKLACEIRKGGVREAILYAVGANDTHGLKRTNKDKRKAVLTLLHDDEWAKWSDREIARLCRVGVPLVGELRRLTVRTYSKKRRYRTKHGTEAEMDTAEIGKQKFKDEFKRTGMISRSIVDVLEATQKLPSPDEAAALFRWPDQYTVKDFSFVSAWFADFAAALKGGKHARAA